MRWYPYEQKRGITAKYQFNVGVYNTSRTHKNGQSVNMNEDSQHHDCILAYKLVLDGGCCLSPILSNALKHLAKTADEAARTAREQRRAAGSDSEASDDGASSSGFDDGEDMDQGYALKSIIACVI